MSPAWRTLIETLSSTRLSIFLFGLLAAASIPGTLLQSHREYYRHPFFVILLVVFALHLALCTLQRWKTLSGSTIVVHLGVLLTMTGAVITGTGFVATINIYEGESSKTVYRWDLQKDTISTPEIKVSKINIELQPVPVKIGVMKGTAKNSLHTLNTGETFILDGYSIKAERFDPFKEKVTLSVMQGNRLLGSADTDGASSLPAEFPFSFKLVAFKQTPMKRFRVDLELIENGRIITSGTSEVNAPFHWQGLDFFNTEISADKDGRPYAGIQIVKDPGKYVVYSGMIILSAGTIAAWYRRFRR